MGLDYTRLAGRARTLVAANGRLVDFVRLEQTPQDATQPWNGPEDPDGVNATPQEVVVGVPVAAVPPSNVNELGLTTLDQDLLKRSEIVYIVAPGLGVTANLETMNRIIDGGITYKIIFAEKLRPATTTLIYFMGAVR